MPKLDYGNLADKSIHGECLTRAESLAVLTAPDMDILRLLDAAYQVRKTFCGSTVHIHVLMNAKSGLCAEDCGYCSQSKVSTAPIEKYPMVTEARLLEGARKAKAARAKRFCIVTSGRGATWRDVNFLAAASRKIVDEVGIKVCVSVGLLNEEKARVLREAGVDQVNHNLNTSEGFYPRIASTHTYQDRLATLQAARNAGMSLCTGAIVGVGESNDDVVDVFMALRDLNPQSIPVNFLHPIEGTPLQGLSGPTPHQCLRILCLARFLNPRQEIRVAGGRELHLRSLQAMALYPANSIFTEGYLTTPGQKTQESWRMIEDLGFEVQVDDVVETEATLAGGAPND